MSRTAGQCDCLPLKLTHIDEYPVVDWAFRQLRGEFTFQLVINADLKHSHFGFAADRDIQVLLRDMHCPSLRTKGDGQPEVNT